MRSYRKYIIRQIYFISNFSRKMKKMYYFNLELLKRLPVLMGIPRTEMSKRIGTSWMTYLEVEKGKLSCERLVYICNCFRIPLRHFLVLSPNPKQLNLASDYVLPVDQWKPVEWHNEVFFTLFGQKDSMTGISKAEAASRIGSTNSTIFNQWSQKSSSTRVESLLTVLNEFKLDASVLLKDPNMPIPVPEWDPEGYMADQIVSRLERMKELERSTMENESANRRLRRECERLQRENEALRKGQVQGTSSPAHGVVSEMGMPVRFPLTPRGWKFNQELWDNLPDVLGVPVVEFSEVIGLTSVAYRNNTNVKLNWLVDVCNKYRISPSHFFLPKSEPSVVQDRIFYQISERMFVPVELHMENVKYLFGRYSVIKTDKNDLYRLVGVWDTYFRKLTKGDDEFSRVMTLTDICTQFNISPGVFFTDGNRNKAVYSQSNNEQLMLNAIEIMKEVEYLRGEVRKLKKKLGWL